MCQAKKKKKKVVVRLCIVCLFHGSPCSIHSNQSLCVPSHSFFAHLIRFVHFARKRTLFPLFICSIVCHCRVALSFFSLFDCVPVLTSFLLALYKRPSSILFIFSLFFFFSYSLKNKQIKLHFPTTLSPNKDLPQPHTHIYTYTNMSNLMRVVPKTLPRVSMARIPVVAFANSSHPSAYSSSSWAESAKNAADKLEQSAKSMAKDVRIPSLSLYPFHQTSLTKQEEGMWR